LRKGPPSFDGPPADASVTTAAGGAQARRGDAAHRDLCGWHSGKELQRRLQAAVDAADVGS
jgi:hypothetical protein